MQPGIYGYWEGENRHWFYDVCWRSVLKWNPSATLLGPSDVEDVIGPLPKAVQEAYVVHRVDWIRKRFIHEVGGLWLDLDFICWSDLAPLNQLTSTVDFIGWKEWHGTGWMDNLFVGAKRSPILETAATYALEQMQAAGKDVQWLATNAHAMNHAMNQHKWSKWMQIPTHLIGPVSVMEKDWFTKDGNINADDYQSLGFMTSFHGLGGWLKTFRSENELLSGNTNLAALLRRAFR